MNGQRLQVKIGWRPAIINSIECNTGKIYNF